MDYQETIDICYMNRSTLSKFVHVYLNVLGNNPVSWCLLLNRNEQIENEISFRKFMFQWDHIREKTQPLYQKKKDTKISADLLWVGYTIG